MEQHICPRFLLNRFLLIVFLLFSCPFLEVSDKEKEEVSPKDLQELFNSKYSTVKHFWNLLSFKALLVG